MLERSDNKAENTCFEQSGPKFAMLQRSNNTTDRINATKAAMLERSHNSTGNAWDRSMSQRPPSWRGQIMHQPAHVTDKTEPEATVMERS